MEILLVTAMITVISLAVYNAFSNGFKLWARGQHVTVEGDMSIFLDRISGDLRQTVLMSTIPFKGNSEELSFPAIILASTDINSSRTEEGTGRQIGAIQYTYDPAEKKIYRSQAFYGQALKEDWPQPQEVASLIEGIDLRYYFKADHGLQVKTQTEEGVPMGVMIDIQFLVDGQMVHMRRFMTIPVGGGL